MLLVVRQPQGTQSTQGFIPFPNYIARIHKIMALQNIAFVLLVVRQPQGTQSTRGFLWCSQIVIARIREIVLLQKIALRALSG